MSTMRDRQDKAAKEAFGHGGVGYSSMHHALQDFIDKYLALEDRLEAVDRLAIGWELRGESDMAFSKRIPDPDIAVAILTNGAQMVENARHIRNALEGTA